MIEPQNQRRNDGRAYEKFKPNHFVIALVVSIFRQARAAAGYPPARCALKNATPRGRRICPPETQHLPAGEPDQINPRPESTARRLRMISAPAPPVPDLSLNLDCLA
jgi:hypothetical protein